MGHSVAGRTERDDEYGVRGLNLESIRLFLLAYEEGNLTRAAQRGNIALSALTKRIQTLEQQLQAPLFERHARGIVPTSAGDEFAYHVRDIFKRVNFAQQAIAEFSTGVRGRVRISATPSVIVGGLADHIVNFARQHPRIEIELKESDAWSVVPDIESGRSDLGLNMSVVEVPPGMTAVDYHTVDLLAVVPDLNPLASQKSVSFEDLLPYEHISLGERSTLRDRCIQHAQELGREFRYRTVSSFDVMRSMVSAGLGVAIMPEMMARYPLERSRLVAIPITEDWARRSFKIWTRDEALVPASRLFREYLLTHEPSC